MNTNDYADKVNNLLNDDKTYHKITEKRRNPTSCTAEKSLNKLPLQIRYQPASHYSSKKQLERKLYYKLHRTDSTPASFYGLKILNLPKIVPLRPIMSIIGSPTYKYLCKILSPPQNNKYVVENSAFFVDKILTLSVVPDEILVSFDVVLRFTCIRNT